MKKLAVILFLICLPVFAEPLKGNVKQNLTTIKCNINDKMDMTVTLKGYRSSTTQKFDNYEMILIIDDNNNKIMDMYKNSDEYIEPKVTSDLISFRHYSTFKGLTHDVSYNINRLTGGVYGLGSSSSEDYSSRMFTTHSISGKCAPYTIQKQF